MSEPFQSVVELADQPGMAKLQLAPGVFLKDSYGDDAVLPTPECLLRRFKGDYSTPPAVPAPQYDD
jgi:hypothetical protein